MQSGGKKNPYSFTWLWFLSWSFSCFVRLLFLVCVFFFFACLHLAISSLSFLLFVRLYTHPHIWSSLFIFRLIRDRNKSQTTYPNLSNLSYLSIYLSNLSNRCNLYWIYLMCNLSNLFNLANLSILSLISIMYLHVTDRPLYPSEDMREMILFYALAIKDLNLFPLRTNFFSFEWFECLSGGTFWKVRKSRMESDHSISFQIQVDLHVTSNQSTIPSVNHPIRLSLIVTYPIPSDTSFIISTHQQIIIEMISRIEWLWSNKNRQTSYLITLYQTISSHSIPSVIRWDRIQGKVCSWSSSTWSRGYVRPHKGCFVPLFFVFLWMVWVFEWNKELSKTCGGKSCSMMMDIEAIHSMNLSTWDHLSSSHYLIRLLCLSIQVHLFFCHLEINVVILVRTQDWRGHLTLIFCSYWFFSFESRRFSENQHSLTATLLLIPQEFHVCALYDIPQ